MASRGFVRNSLNTFGDLIPFMYINIFKNKRKLKNKYLKYLTKFYINWEKYPQLLFFVTTKTQNRPAYKNEVQTKTDENLID